MKARNILTMMILLLVSLFAVNLVAAEDVTIPPVAIASATPTSGTVPLVVTLIGTGIDPDGGEIVEYQWDFGDGSVEYVQNAIHVYSSPGTYGATLIVRDDEGNTGSDYVLITVESPNIPPVAIASATPTEGDSPLNVVFIGTGLDPDGGEIVEYRWDFGDGVSVYAQNPQHTYSYSGVYEATLFVRDDEGATASDHVVINVNTKPTAAADANPVTGSAPLDVYFVGAGHDVDGDVVEYKWEFGDGSVSNEQNPQHTYQEAGSFTAKLTVTDDLGGTAYDTVTITVEDDNLPPSAIAIANPNSGVAPLNVNFMGNGFDSDGEIVEYKWEFNDGTPDSYMQSPAHQFMSAGEYQVVLTVRDNDGATASDIVSVLVEDSNLPPVVYANAQPGEGDSPLTILFSATGADADGEIVEYRWDFGDGRVAYGQSLIHTYVDVGEFTATVTVRDDDGATASNSVPIKVNQAYVNIPPVVVATAAPTNGYAPLVVQFVGNGFDSDGEIMEYRWDFKDGSVSYSKNPTHTFLHEGEYNVVVTVTDDQGDTASDTVLIKVMEVPVVVNRAPVISPIPDQTVLEGSAYSYNVQATDPNVNDTLFYAITGPSWLTINSATGVISGTVGNIGNYSVTVTVNDGQLYASESFMLEVVESGVNQAPVIPTISNQTVFVNTTYIFAINAYDPDNDPITYTLVAGPSWLNITQDGDLFGTPRALGEYNVTVMVSDYEFNVTENFMIRVIEEPEEEEEERGIVNIDRIRLSRGEYLPIGDMLATSISVSNIGNDDLDDVKVTVGIPDLGVKKTEGPFDLRDGRDELKKLYIEIPEYAQPGDYYIRITISNDKMHRVVHRLFTVIG